MSDHIASKWNARYAYSGEPPPAPAQVLSAGTRWLPEPMASGAGFALDLACGRAGNGHWLAQRGFEVSAWDISENAINAILARQPGLIQDAAVRDVILNPPEPDSFDLIVVCRFLDRNLCTAISNALRPGGTLFYQTFTHGLANPDFLLGPNELLGLFDGLDMLEYHEPPPDTSGKAEARLIARQPATMLNEPELR